MSFSKEERMDIGRRMFNKEISYRDAMEIYGISETCAHKCMTDYKRANNIPLQKGLTKGLSTTGKENKRKPSNPDIETYMSMSKEELINELILAKANELRAKKGYEVRGVGANKEFIPLNRSNLKS